MISKVLKILRQEGVSGILARLRFRKNMSSKQVNTPQINLPIYVLSTDSDLEKTLRSSLLEIVGPSGISFDDEHTTLHVSPSADTFLAGLNDAIFFISCDDALQYLTDGKLSAAIDQCAAIIFPGLKSFQAFVDAGFPLAKAFIRSGDTNADTTVLARWLIAAKAISFKHVDPNVFEVLRNLRPGARLCLSLPEVPKRRRHFTALTMSGFKFFDGVRYNPSWKGSGISFSTIANGALEQNAFPLIVCEDDVVPAHQFEDHLEAITDYLNTTEWDLFSGLLTNISDHCKIERIEQQHGLVFVHLDCAVGMVCNIYNKNALARLAAWEADEGDIHGNAIDVWLGTMPNLKVVTTLPFLAGHDSSLTSTIFGFSNRRYDAMIKSSEARLTTKVQKILQSKTS